MSPPARSAEQRRAALARAMESRRARADLIQRLRDGRVLASEVLDQVDDEPTIAALPVRAFLQALPGIGPGRAEDALQRLDISSSRRLRGLGDRQRAALRSWLVRREERSPRASIAPTHRAPLIVVSGPSGVGKSTVVRAALEQAPDAWLSVSATTRTPRPGEVDGREYHFVSPGEFESMVHEGQLLEWAEYAGRRYGTPRRPVEEHRAQGRPVLLEIEVHGARQVRTSAPDALLVFIAPPSGEALVERLERRGTEDRAAVQRRLTIASEELKAQGEFDVVLVNDDVHATATALIACVRDAVAP